ncbi:MAG: YciI family protein [Hyphomicrobiaceae bacterium]|nr:YciI family protein [Hyphomicrobiaceae bacterium]
MRFMCIYRPADTGKLEDGLPPTQDEVTEMGKLIGDMIKAGVLLATDGLLPSSRGARVRLSGGKFTVIDRRFTEAKELIAGFAIIRVGSNAEAIEWGKRFLKIAGDGESEIRLMWDSPAFPPERSAA